ncbi:hypothetical protein [Streptomyces inhibens]|uniref:hypothetical protein n=1 Tax=Streptomyces inhibens TaxID=2293571 RepID=UPI001EE753E2|nr:hypothetical protein [Streptomyces inhibens]UKY54540.1 hypothetical protein KI385_40860 [Streptomyces inhibens]
MNLSRRSTAYAYAYAYAVAGFSVSYGLLPATRAAAVLDRDLPEPPVGADSGRPVPALSAPLPETRLV